MSERKDNTDALFAILMGIGLFMMCLGAYSEIRELRDRIAVLERK